MEPNYLQEGTFTIPKDTLVNMKYLYNLCKASKVDYVTIFKDNYSIYFTGFSYAKNLKFFEKVRITKTEINNEGNTSDNEQLEDIGLDGLDDMFKSFAENTYTQDNIDEILRFGVPLPFIKAVSILTEDVTITVDSDRITLDSDGTRLTYTNIKTYSELEDVSSDFDGVFWEKLKTNSVVAIASALAKTKDPMYQYYITVSGDKVYSNCISFSIEVPSWSMQNSYTLPYPVVELITKIPKNSETRIGIKGSDLFIDVNGLFFSLALESGDINDMQLINKLPKTDYGMVFMIPNVKDWSKLDLIQTYSISGVEEEVHINTTKYGLLFSKDENTCYISSEYNEGFEIEVELELLKMARKLSGSDKPKIYADCTGKLATLLIVGEATVAIRAKSITVDTNLTANIVKLATLKVSDGGSDTKGLNRPGSLRVEKEEENIQSPQEVKEEENILPQTMSQEEEEELSRVIPPSFGIEDTNTIEVNGGVVDESSL